ncbi:hypothetical protein E2C01_029429 [Portunus trituberculatus]|uniref:Uncharacterized protein n=1 Tax=Portunus trituberculatus TaxID=210409 RepID=A0A5B7ES76_PORTR|nr:hypothetical protein [Portunus trituberculatus]
MKTVSVLSLQHLP